MYWQKTKSYVENFGRAGCDLRQPLKGAALIYFILAEQPGRVKIGYAADPHQRKKDLQVGSPVPLALIAVIPGDRTTEPALHKRFARVRSHGEWFEFDDTIKQFLIEHGRSPYPDLPSPGELHEAAKLRQLLCEIWDGSVLP